MLENLSRRYTKYFWKTIAYHLQTWRLLSVITKTCWGGSTDLQPSAICVSSKAKRKKSQPSPQCLHSPPFLCLSPEFTKGHWNTSVAVMQQHQNFRAVVESDVWIAFGVQIWPACLHPCKYPYNLINWGGIWRCHSCYIMFLDSYLKPSCTWMLICTVHSDVLIIFLLKTCWHYPGDTRNVNAAFPVKFGPWGWWGFLFALPGLQGTCGDAPLWDGHSQLLRPPQEAQGVWTVTIIISTVALFCPLLFLLDSSRVVPAAHFPSSWAPALPRARVGLD